MLWTRCCFQTCGVLVGSDLSSSTLGLEFCEVFVTFVKKSFEFEYCVCTIELQGLEKKKFLRFLNKNLEKVGDFQKF